MNNFIKNLEQIPNKTPQETFDKLLESNPHRSRTLQESHERRIARSERQMGRQAKDRNRPHCKRKL